MKKRMAILMSMAIAANMIASVPVCATDIFTDSMPTDSAITQETDDDSFSDGSGTPDFADEQENVQAAQDEGTQSAKEPPVVTAEYEIVFGSPTYKINGEFGSDYVDNIQQISVNGNNLTKASLSSWLSKGEYYLCGSSDQYIKFSANSFEVNDQIVITSTGYKDLTLKVTGTGKQWAVEKVTSQPEPEQTKDAPAFAGDQVKILYTDYKIIKPADENTDSDYIRNITEISVDGTPWEKTDRAAALFNRKAYYPDSSNNRVVFDSTVLHTGNVITIKSDGYKELYLKVNAEGNDFTVVVTDSDKTNINGASNGVNTLHVRLKGYFESAVKGQKKYDAVSGASTSVSSNKNSNVVVEAADLPDGQEPVETDWKVLKETGVKIDTKKTTVNIDSKSGMAGRYSTYDSSLSLSGIPAEPGTYPVSVTVTDESGRTVTSNELTFKVYSTKEKLADHLNLDNATPTADGKYMYEIGKKGDGEGEYKRMNGVILRNDTLFVVDGNYDFTRYNWQGEYLGKLFCPRIRHTLNFFLIPNTGMFLGHVDNHTGKKEVRFVFFRDTTAIKIVPNLDKYEPASSEVVYSAPPEMKAFDGLVPAFKEVFNDTIYQVDEHLNLVPYAVVELGKYKATKEAMFACTAEQLMKKWDFFNGKIALAATGEKDGIIYLAHHDVTDPYTYSYDKNAKQAFYQKVIYPDNSYRFKEGSTFVPHFISTDGKYLIDYEIPENGNSPVIVLVER